MCSAVTLSPTAPSLVRHHRLSPRPRGRGQAGRARTRRRAADAASRTARFLRRATPSLLRLAEKVLRADKPPQLWRQVHLPMWGGIKASLRQFGRRWAALLLQEMQRLLLLLLHRSRQSRKPRSCLNQHPKRRPSLNLSKFGRNRKRKLKLSLSLGLNQHLPLPK